MKLRSKQIVAIVTGLVIGLSSMSVMAKPKKAGRSSSNECSKYYNGYVGGIEFKKNESEWYGSRTANYYGDFIVIATGNGNVTIKGLEKRYGGGGNYPHTDEILSMSCSSLKSIEY